METLVINIDNTNDADALMEQLSHLKFVKSVVRTHVGDDVKHLLPGEPLDDVAINKLLDEAEADDELLDIKTLEENMLKKFNPIWASSSERKQN